MISLTIAALACAFWAQNACPGFTTLPVILPDVDGGAVDAVSGALASDSPGVNLDWMLGCYLQVGRLSWYLLVFLHSYTGGYWAAVISS